MTRWNDRKGTLTHGRRGQICKEIDGHYPISFNAKFCEFANDAGEWVHAARSRAQAGRREMTVNMKEDEVCKISKRLPLLLYLLQ